MKTHKLIALSFFCFIFSFFSGCIGEKRLSDVRTGVYQTKGFLDRTLILKNRSFILVNETVEPNNPILAKETYFGYWKLISKNKILFQIEDDWFSLQEQSFDPNLRKEDIRLVLTDSRGDSLGIDYQINRGYPKYSSYRTRDGDWIFQSGAVLSKRYKIDSIKMYDEEDRAGLLFSQTFPISCDSCNTFRVKAKFPKEYLNAQWNTLPFPQGAYKYKNGKIFLKKWIGENMYFKE